MSLTLCRESLWLKDIRCLAGLYGSNNWEAAICDQILETIAAIVQSAVQLKFSAKTEEDKVSICTFDVIFIYFCI